MEKKKVQSMCQVLLIIGVQADYHRSSALIRDVMTYDACDDNCQTGLAQYLYSISNVVFQNLLQTTKKTQRLGNIESKIEYRNCT